MSAYQVDPTIIDLIISKAVELKLYALHPTSGGHTYVTEDNASEFAQALWQENIKSIAYRYDEETAKTDPYTFTFYDNVRPGAAAGCLNCYEYQACEHPGWEASAAHDLCTRLTSKLLTSILTNVPYGVEGDPIAQGFAKPRLTRLTDLIPTKKRAARRA